MNLRKTKRYREDCRRKLDRILWEQEMLSERQEQLRRYCRKAITGESLFIRTEEEDENLSSNR